MFVLLADMVISSSSTTLSNTYKALYGFNWVSSKTNMAIVEAASRVRCGHICDRIFGCGGFNFRSVTTGLFQCEFKQGISSAGDGMIDNSGTYYQKTGLLTIISYRWNPDICSCNIYYCILVSIVIFHFDPVS